MPSRCSSAERVAERYRLAADEALPKKWFATKLTELKSLLKTHHHEGVRSWGWVIDDRLVSYFRKFQSDFEALVSNDQARLVIKRAVDFALEYLDALSTKLRKLDRWSPSDTDPVQRLVGYGWTGITGKMEKTCPTIGDLLKYEWAVDEVGLEALAKKTLKKATPEQLEAIMGDSDRAWQIKFSFLAGVGYYEAAERKAKKTKLEWSPLGWFEKTRAIFEENYAPGLTTAYRNFDLHGMKIIVDDATVTDKEVREYIGYLKEAYERLRIRGLESAWYGVCFIKCEDCGGVNYNTGGGVGGHYFIGPDVVWIYSRPSWFTTKLTVHELGHRYWFKQMNGEQRARFTSLVKARTISRPSKAPKDVGLVSARDLRHQRDVVQAAEKAIAAHINLVGLGTLTPEELNASERKVRDLAQNIADAMAGPRSMEQAFEHPDVKALKKTIWRARTELNTAFFMYTGAEGWPREARALLEQLVSAALELLDLVVKIHNADAAAKLGPEGMAWQQSYFDNPAPVEAVSDYGKSDIDEAFAEVFAHYVLNYDITRDQMESFRSVLSKPGSRRRGLAAQVAARFQTIESRNLRTSRPGALSQLRQANAAS